MDALYTADFSTPNGRKSISVFNCDILAFDERIDILTTSAYARNYVPVKRSMFGALASVGINVNALAEQPAIDLRSFCNVWLSAETGPFTALAGRIGCVETARSGHISNDQALINSVSSYFHMLDIAAVNSVAMDTVALPLLGSGTQGISTSLILVPIMNECIAFIKRNASVKRIYIIERSFEKAQLAADVLRRAHTAAERAVIPASTRSAGDALVFISHSSVDRAVAEKLCHLLEIRNIKVWYAPRNVHGAYADSIVDGIERASHFVVITSQSSMKSEHVLNEVNLAFQRLHDGLSIKPVRIDSSPMSPSFQYYLSRQHWVDVSGYPDALEFFAAALSDEISGN